MEMWRFVVGDNAVEIENDGADYRWASLGRLAAPLERMARVGQAALPCSLSTTKVFSILSSRSMRWKREMFEEPPPVLSLLISGIFSV